MLRLNGLTEVLLYSAALLGYLPLAPYLQRFPALTVPATIVFAVIGGQKGLTLKERPALLVAAGCFLYYALQFSRHNVAVPAANMLAILLAIRLAGDKSPRNFLQTITLALFCLAASTLFDLSPSFVIYLLLLLLIFTVSLVLLTFQSTAADFRPAPKELRAVLSVALLQPLTALPLIVLLFFVLPRTQFPLWSGISMAGSDRPGVADTVQPGDKSSVSSSRATLFRAEMPQVAPEDLYWRAMVLNTPEKSRWVRKEPPGESKVSAPAGRAIQQTIYLEPNRIRYLPALDLPQSLSGARGEPSADRLYAPSRFTAGRRSYGAFSRPDGMLTEKSLNRRFYTTLPANIPAGLTRISAESATARTDTERLRRIQDAFRKLRLSYSSTELPTGDDALERFLFSGKKGHCELFATAFVAALRGAGLPARLVGGYYGGEYNELAGYYAVSEERAHLWTEVWLEGSGWTRVDPSRFAVNFDEARRVKTPTLLLKLQLAADTFTYYWNRAVITYDLESQFAAVGSVGAGLRSLKGGELPLRRIAIGSGCLLLCAAGFHLATRRRATAEEKLLKAFRRALQRRYGLDIPATSGLHEAIKGIENGAVQEFVAVYTGAIYRDRRLTETERTRLQSLLSGIRRK